VWDKKISNLIDLEEPVLTNDELKIYVHVMVRSYNPKTIRIKARINNHPVIMLMDTKSTYNIIYLKFTRKVRVDTMALQTLG
jgi:hypothetical protein